MSDVDDSVTTDVFGLSGTFPCPGWRVLDAARSHRFTGEVTCATIPATKVYFDAGQIYLAERVSDPSLGARLVDAGALSAAQLERGSMFVGGVAHLGRLFERVSSVDRQQVLLVAELMTEERVGWLAGRLVAGITLAPYRHHPTGVRRWAGPTQPPTAGAAEPLPAPLTGGAPTESGAVDSGPTDSKHADDTPLPGDVESSIEPAGGGAMRWDQSSVLEQGGVPAASPLAPPAASAVPLPAPAAAEPVRATTPPQSTADGGESAPAPGEDPVDRFEVIWPSGEVVDQVELPRHPAAEPLGSAAHSGSSPSVLHDVGAGGSSVDSTIEQPGWRPPPDLDAWMVASDDSSDAVALAVRRAVATIETGSLEARRRFVASPSDADRSREDGLRDMMSTPIASSLRRAPVRSVFDDSYPDEDTIPESPQPEALGVEPSPADGDERAGALRRLIDSMRRE